MIKKTLQILSLFVLVFEINGQESIKIIPDWNNFKTQEFEVKRIKYEEKNDSLIRNDTSLYLGEWKYKEFDKNEHILIWTLKDEFLPNEKHNKYLSENLEVIYSTNNEGEFIEVKNWSTIKKYFKGILKEIKLQTENKLAYKFVKMFYRDKDYLLNIVGKEIDALHRIYGLESIGEEEILKYEEESYNILIDDAIKTNIEIYIDSKIENENRVVFKKEKKYDPKSANEVAIKMLNKYSSHDEDSIKENMKDIKFDLQKNEILEYNYETNLPIRIELEQRNITELGVENSLKIKKSIIKKIK